ncbi:MAG: hypothetical protein ACYTBZ_23915 [Planctomycetota bacterium]|jgi:hypothetical protein
MSTHYRDLCSTCNHTTTCGVRGTRRKPVFYCEEFDIYLRVSAPRVTQAAPQGKVGYNHYNGLCFDCENRTNCSVSGSDEGIWHCEEYR